MVVDPTARITHIKGAATRGKRHGAQVEMLRARLQLNRKTMPPLVALLLLLYRVIRLLLNTAVNLLAVLLTFGLIGRFRDKLAVYLTQLAWLALGKPEHWGLPDKCLRGRDPVMTGES